MTFDGAQLDENVEDTVEAFVDDSTSELSEKETFGNAAVIVHVARVGVELEAEAGDDPEGVRRELRGVIAVTADAVEGEEAVPARPETDYAPGSLGKNAGMIELNMDQVSFGNGA